MNKPYSAARAQIVSSTKASRLKRRSFRKLRTVADASHHYNVYVVLLDPAVRNARKVRLSNPDAGPKKLCLYVGMTGLDPNERFANHKAGIKSAGVVQRFGTRLLPEYYAHLNPMPFAAAARMEIDLAEDLRQAGHTVTGGH